MPMMWTRVSQWAIRVIIVASLLGILTIILFPGLTSALRLSAVGIALQLAGVALAIPEVSQRLSGKGATDLIIWAETFFPLWKILGKLHITKTLGQLSIVLAIVGIVSIIVGLILQYLAVYYF